MIERKNRDYCFLYKYMKWALTHCQIFVTIKSLNNLSPDWPLSDFYKKKKQLSLQQMFTLTLLEINSWKGKTLKRNMVDRNLHFKTQKY